MEKQKRFWEYFKFWLEILALIVGLCVIFIFDIPQKVKETFYTPTIKGGNTPIDNNKSENSTQSAILIDTNLLKNIAIPNVLMTSSIMLIDGPRFYQIFQPPYNKIEPLSNGQHDGLQVDSIITYDFNSDNYYDNVVLLSWNGGGSGTWHSLIIILNNNGHPELGPSILLEDREEFNNIRFIENKMSMELLIHGYGDGLCCPSKKALLNVELKNKKLIVISKDIPDLSSD